MVAGALSFGGIVGVLLSGGFIYWEVGRFAAPQVPATLFDERKELFAYTAGLFAGVPLAVPLLLLMVSMSNGALPGALLFLAMLVGGTELAQWLLLRSRYFGSGPSGPFYALGFRTGIGGILILAIVAEYLSGPALALWGAALVGSQSIAILLLEAGGSLISIRRSSGEDRVGGGPLSGALIGGTGFFLVSFGALFGPSVGIAGSALAAIGALLAYRRSRAILERVPPPGVPAGPTRAPVPEPAYGRVQR